MSGGGRNLDKKTNVLSKTARRCGWIQAAATLSFLPTYIPICLREEYIREMQKQYVCWIELLSVPAGACPIGAFQAVVGSSKFKFTYYITGFFILLGVVFGRFICGFLCPFGWFQDLLHKIPGKKFSQKAWALRYLKYIILLVFVILLPVVVTNLLEWEIRSSVNIFVLREF